VVYLGAHGRHPRYFGGSYCISRHRKMLFYRVCWNVLVSSFYLCDMCLRWWSGLALVDLLFFLFSLPTLKNYNLILLVIGISTSVIIFLISHFRSWFSCKNFICFQFYHSIIIYQILYSLIWSSFFGFLIFYFCTFVNVLLIFNFIIQFKLKVLCFPIWLSLFWFLFYFFYWPFYKIYYSFQFHPKIKKIVFYVNFDPHFLDFFFLLLDWFFFSISHFNQI
jgi:hypothetical protein